MSRTAHQDTRPLRVLWLADKLGYGDLPHDVGQFYLTMLPVIQDRVEVIPAVLRSADGLTQRFAAERIHLVLLRYGRFDPRTVWALVRLIRRHEIDILHAHGEGASVFGRLAGWLTRTPVILHQHDRAAQSPWYVQISNRLLKRLAARTIATSTAVKQFCAEDRFVATDQIRVYPQGVPAPYVAPQETREALRQRWAIPEDHRVVGAATRLMAEKAPERLMEAIGRALRLAPATTFLLIGSGSERDALIARAKQLGINDRVRFVHAAIEIESLFPLFDCFVLHAVGEGVPHLLLEAMAAGLPIVTNDAGGTREVLQHGRTGYLVASRDPRALADGIIAVLDDRGLREHLGRRAAEAAVAHDVRFYAAQLTSLYQEVSRVGSQPPATSQTRQKWWSRFRTLVRYSIVGISGGVIHFSLLAALVEWGRWPVLPATTVGFVAAVANNFFWNRVWTFRSRERNIRLQFVRFLSVSVLGLIWNTLGMAVLATHHRWPYLLSQAVTTAGVWGWNFLANTYWAFQPLRVPLPAAPSGQQPYELSIVIPAYNEARRLSWTVERVAAHIRSRGLRAELILVDDGSTDATLSLATNIPVDGMDVRVVHCAVNRGKGAAIGEGFLAARGAYFLMADADNSIPIECLDVLWPYRAERRVVIGSRYVESRRRQPDVSWLRYWIGRAGNQLIQWSLLPGIHDTQCGFKLLSAPVAKALASRQRIRGFGFDMELLAIARALGVEIREVTIHWKPVAGSRVRPFRDACRALGELALVKGFLWCGFYHTQVGLAAPAEVSSPAVSAAGARA